MTRPSEEPVDVELVDVRATDDLIEVIVTGGERAGPERDPAAATLSALAAFAREGQPARPPLDDLLAAAGLALVPATEERPGYLRPATGPDPTRIARGLRRIGIDPRYLSRASAVAAVAAAVVTFGLIGLTTDLFAPAGPGTPVATGPASSDELSADEIALLLARARLAAEQGNDLEAEQYYLRASTLVHRLRSGAKREALTRQVETLRVNLGLPSPEPTGGEVTASTTAAEQVPGDADGEPSPSASEPETTPTESPATTVTPTEQPDASPSPTIAPTTQAASPTPSTTAGSNVGGNVNSNVNGGAASPTP